MSCFSREGALYLKKAKFFSIKNFIRALQLAVRRLFTNSIMITVGILASHFCRTMGSGIARRTETFGFSNSIGYLEFKICHFNELALNFLPQPWPYKRHHYGKNPENTTRVHISSQRIPDDTSNSVFSDLKLSRFRLQNALMRWIPTCIFITRSSVHTKALTPILVTMRSGISESRTWALV